MKILVLNSGSSSQKACLYEIGGTLPDHPLAPLWEGKIEWRDTAAITVKNSHGVTLKEELPVSSREQLIQHLLRTARDGKARAVASASEIDAVGHRVVHGGPHFEDPVVVTREVRAAIDSVSGFAPLHIRAELEGMKIVENLLGAVPQVAVFDTGFHRQMPLPAAIYPGPYEWFQRGIRRYGFHGINHQYCAERAAQMLGAGHRALKIVSCHLGNGCSVTAIQEGRSIDTTMGFTPLEGLMMGTRSGSVDPGILTYLMRQDQLDGQSIDNVLNQKSGLLGISGLSSDMRDILAAAESGHEREAGIRHLCASVCERRSVPWSLSSAAWMSWCSPRSVRTPLRCEPRLVMDWNFLACDWIIRQMLDPLSIRMCLPRTRECAFWSFGPRKTGPLPKSAGGWHQLPQASE
jgi:acetate kinase